MGKLLSYTVLFLAANVGLFFLFSLVIPLLMTDKDEGYGLDRAIAILVAVFIAFMIELVVAVFLINTKTRKDIGKAILLSIGIIFLFGLSVCNGLWG